jgi:2-C-methyl-D-erythritol 4-phosphate cytidylyltransferase
LESYQQKFDSSFTDDASVAEHNGVEISLVKGNKENIKITTPEDLEIALTFINR